MYMAYGSKFETFTLLEEFRRWHGGAVPPPCASPFRAHYPSLVDALELSDLVSQVYQQLPLFLQLFSRDFALLSHDTWTSRGKV